MAITKWSISGSEKCLELGLGTGRAFSSLGCRALAASSPIGLVLERWRSKLQAKYRFVGSKKRFQLCFMRNFTG
jgi:hypothetical protein